MGGKWSFYSVHLLHSQGTLQANGRFLKKILTYCLVILIMSLSVGVWMVSVPMVNFLKRRASSEMQQTSNQLCLRLRPESFKRVGSDELVVEGRLYDVISEQQQGDWVKFVLYRDDLETYFLQFLMTNLGSVDSSGDDSSPLGKIIKNILHLEFYLIPLYVFDGLVPSFSIILKISFLAVLPMPPTLKVPLPPPRLL